MGLRSPPNLRKRKLESTVQTKLTQSKTQISKKQTPETNQAQKIDKESPKSNSETKISNQKNMSKTKTVENQNEINGNLVSKIHNELQSIKKEIKQQQKTNTMTFTSIRDEINNNYSENALAIKSILAEIQTIKSITRNDNVMSFNSEGNIRFIDNDYITIRLAYIVSDIEKSKLQANFFYADIFNKIDALNESDQVTRFTIENLVEATEILATMKISETKITATTDDYNENQFIQNAVECMQIEVNKSNLSMMKNEERIMKMYDQILSAKYIQFNSKINQHILNFNKQHNGTLDRNKLVDPEAMKYVCYESPPEKKTHS